MGRTGAFIMPELNYGQMFFEMQRVIDGKPNRIFFSSWRWKRYTSLRSFTGR